MHSISDINGMKQPFLVLNQDAHFSSVYLVGFMNSKSAFCSSANPEISTEELLFMIKHIDCSIFFLKYSKDDVDEGGGNIA